MVYHAYDGSYPWYTMPMVCYAYGGSHLWCAMPMVYHAYGVLCLWWVISMVCYASVCLLLSVLAFVFVGLFDFQSVFTRYVISRALFDT